MSEVATASDFFAGCTLKRETVASGGKVYRVRELTPAEYRAYLNASLKDAGNGKTRFDPDYATLLRYGVEDEHGKPIFSDADIAKLRSNEVGISRVLPLAKAIYRLCGDEDTELIEGN